MDPQFANDADYIAHIGEATRHRRTPDQTEAGIYWGYDGSVKLGVPPRFYNQIAAARLLATPVPPGIESERRAANVLAQVNVALADAAIDAWHWKFVYDLLRPVAYFRPPPGVTALGTPPPNAIAGPGILP